MISFPIAYGYSLDATRKEFVLLRQLFPKRKFFIRKSPGVTRWRIFTHFFQGKNMNERIKKVNENYLRARKV